MSGLPFSASGAAVDFVLLCELGGNVKDCVFLTDPCLLPTLLLVLVLNRSTSFDVLPSANIAKVSRLVSSHLIISSLHVCATFQLDSNSFRYFGMNLLSPQALC